MIGTDIASRNFVNSDLHVDNLILILESKAVNEHAVHPGTNYPPTVNPSQLNPWLTEPRQCGCAREVNVGSTERVASMLGGALLAAYGLSGGQRGSLLALLAGAGLIYRGATGHCSGYKAIGVSTA
jgi:hypothetical protein